MGNHLIVSSGESAAPIAPGKRDVANRGLETPPCYMSIRNNNAYVPY